MWRLPAARTSVKLSTASFILPIAKTYPVHCTLSYTAVIRFRFIMPLYIKTSVPPLSGISCFLMFLFLNDWLDLTRKLKILTVTVVDGWVFDSVYKVYEEL